MTRGSYGALSHGLRNKITKNDQNDIESKSPERDLSPDTNFMIGFLPQIVFN